MQNCNRCQRKNLWQSTNYTDAETGARWWKCRNCGNEQVEEPPQGLYIAPKILYLDIETALMKVWLYDLFGERNKSISPAMADTNRFVINWAAAWVRLGDYSIKTIMSAVTTPNEARHQNDKRILRPLFNLMDEADYICGHNSKGFDVKILKWRFLFHGWGYPSNSKQVDTLTLARQSKPESRSLDYMLKKLGRDGKKHELTRDEWREIAEHGTQRLLNKANRYCRQDVREGVGLLQILTRAENMAGRVLFR
jgi:hypothetical protein